MMILTSSLKINKIVFEKLTVGLTNGVEKATTKFLEVAEVGTPKKTGEMRSESVHQNIQKKDNNKIVIGGAKNDTEYAIKQHETLYSKYTTAGTSYKFFEVPLISNKDLLTEEFKKGFKEVMG